LSQKKNTQQRGLCEVSLAEAALLLQKGAVGVLRTDTLYGIVASANNKKAVARVYNIKKRNPTKPCLLLITKRGELTQFGVMLTPSITKAMKRYWPGPTTLVCDIHDVSAIKKFEYLHCGTNALAFRLPKNPKLIQLMKRTGPLIAPSANIEGECPTRTVDEARAVFGRNIDFYVDGGLVTRKRPSRIFKVSDSVLKRLR